MQAKENKWEKQAERENAQKDSEKPENKAGPPPHLERNKRRG